MGPVEKSILYLSYFSLLPGLVIFIYYFRKLYSVKSYRYLGFILVALLMTEITGRIFMSTGNNLFVFHINSIVDYSLISLIFISVINRSSFRKIVLIGLFLFYVFTFLNTLYLEPLDTFNSNVRWVQGIVTLLYCIYFFYTLFDDANVDDLLKYPFFWMASGMLIYFSGTLFLFIIENNRANGEDSYFVHVHGILNFILNTSYAYTLWLGSKQIK